jgi:signal transduction histidine kinase
MDASGEVRTEAKRRTADAPGAGDEAQRLRSELDRVTDSLERSEARFRDVIERNADAIIVVDRTGVVRFANRMAGKLFGAERGALVGTHFGFPLVAAETIEVDLLSNGTPVVAEMRVVESAWEGDTAYLASLRDVTERKRAEQNERALFREYAARGAAEEMARRLRFLLESTTELTSSLDHEATYTALARLCVTEIADWAEVYSLEDGVIRRLQVAHCDPERAPLLRELHNVVIDPQSKHPVLEVLRSRKTLVAESASEALVASTVVDDRHRAVVNQLGMASLVMIPMVARDRVLGAIGLVRANPARCFDEQDVALAEDIAARAALALDNALLYEEAQKANRAKSDFLAIVSHDLRTPLNAIMGYANLLHMGVPEPVPESARERLTRISTAAEHLLYLLDGLLDFARLESGREEVHPVDVDLREVARELATVIEPLAQQRQITFDLVMPDHPIMLRTDPDKVRQILLNLAGNALKYTERGSVRVTLGAGTDRRGVIEVTDTGMGIAPEHLERIFEPFWQVDSAPRSRSHGTGLGLSVVRRLVQLLGGEVTVESERGRGSTFTVRLPAALGTTG